MIGAVDGGWGVVCLRLPLPLSLGKCKLNYLIYVVKLTKIGAETLKQKLTPTTSLK